MNVLFHSDAFASVSRYGLSRYAWSLFEELTGPDSDLLLTPFSSRPGVADAHLDELRDSFGYIHPGWKHQLLVMAWASGGYPLIEKWHRDADLVHTVELDYPIATRKPWVATVHDLGPLTHPEYFSHSRPWLRRLGLNAAARHADVIVAVSTATAEAIEHLAPCSLGDRLRVVPEGVDSVFFEPAADGVLNDLEHLPPPGTPFFLWTGSMNPRKNLANVLAAFNEIVDEVPHHLVLAGGVAWDSDAVLAGIRGSACRERIHRPGFVSDEQLRALYRRADAFVYVSLMEGFGLPVLEAMAGGCPVITSDLSSMPEVAGSAAITVSPTDVSAIASAMKGVATDRALADRMCKEGLIRAKSFSWSTTAEMVRDIYSGVIR